jgi:tripartite-type tricarboxylate transporter receptor subunit TctC
MKGRLALALFCAVTASSTAMADNFPTREIRFIAPFSAGGPTDIAARVISEPLRKQLGQSIITENMPGASGVIGTQAVITGKPDGHTLLVGGIAPIVLVSAVKELKYDVARDLAPLGIIWRSPEVLVVRPTLKVSTVKELVAHLKGLPDKGTFGSAGVGTLTHLAGELFKQEASVDLVHVPYKSTSNSMLDVSNGQLDMIFGDVAILEPMIRSGMVKALAVTSDQRSPILPDVPTMAEAGYPKVHTEIWFGLMAPAKTPAPVLKKLEAAVIAAQKDPDYQKDLARFGVRIGEAGPQGLRNFIKAESERWTPILKKTGVTF